MGRGGMSRGRKNEGKMEENRIGGREGWNGGKGGDGGNRVGEEKEEG